ncbi:MAG TPA: hypothetical protein VJ740_03700 [Hyphomicrobiaceae bacterium]|jgi:hypothetical protein|nr:hypothetical protein [Hyphomicrobiaceae bacterium]
MQRLPQTERPTARERRASFISNLVIEHGPSELIGRLLLAADTEARNRGVFLSFAPMHELMAANRANSDSWRPLLPIFDPARAGFAEQTAFCLLGYNDAGEIVLTQAARYLDWRHTSFHEEATSLRLFYRDPEAMRGEGEAVRVTAPSARRISGRLAFTGAHWCRPDFRQRGLPSITPRIARALAIARWDIELTCTIMAQDIYTRRVAQAAGYFNSEWTVDLENTPTGTFPAALLWSDRDAIIADLEDFLVGLPHADVAVVHRHA